MSGAFASYGKFADMGSRLAVKQHPDLLGRPLNYKVIDTEGNAGKAEMIAAAKAHGHDPVDDNHADALALLDWAMAQGGVA